jgi:hypothetical protein
MSIMAGFTDLKPKDVLVFNSNGTIMVVINGKVETLQLQLQPTGILSARPVEKPGLDQPGERRVRSREERLAMTDQGREMI